jgi:hypothetical protein
MHAPAGPRSWQPEVASCGAVRTWAGWADCCREEQLVKVSGPGPGIPEVERFSMYLAAWVDHGRICSRN